MRNLLFVSIILSGSFLLADPKCNNISTYAGNMSVYGSNGKITIENQNLNTTKMKDSPGGWENAYAVKEVKINGLSTGSIVSNEFRVKRNENGQPIEIQAYLTGGLGMTTSGLGVGSGYIYRFNYSKDGSCELSRIQTGNEVLFDLGLCKDLSSQLSKFKKSDIEMCNKIIFDMASSIQNFKNSVKLQGLFLSEKISKNSYQDALLQSAECRKNLTGQEDKLNSLAIPQSGKTKAVQ